MNKKMLFLISRAAFVFVLLVFAMGCKDDAVNDGDITDGETVETLYQDKVDCMNIDAEIINGLVNGSLEVTTTWVDDNGNCSVQFSNELVTIVYDSENYDKMKTIPLLGVDENSNWIYEYYDDTFPLKDSNGNTVSAKGSTVPAFRLNKTNYWEYTLDGKSWMRLSDKTVGKIENAGRGSYSLFKEANITSDLSSMTLKLKTGSASYTVNVKPMETTLAWNKFLVGAEDNVLLDFSYAGYMHGEVAPPDVNIDFTNKKTDSKGNPYYEANISGGAQGSAKYKVYNIVDYGAIADDGNSDRHALIKILEEVMGCTKKDEDSFKTLRYQLGGSSNANAIIYFPEGRYVLRGGTDVEATETIETLRFTMGNFIFKGAGRDKTTIEMAVKNNPRNKNEMWSTPPLLDFKNNSGIDYKNSLANVTGNAEKGTFSVEVSSTSGINEGDWVCLYLKNNDAALIAEELAPYSLDPEWTELGVNGVQIEDLHQVKKITGNTIEFYEPIMRKVEEKWGWTIRKYSHYENVGVEDLKLLGHSKDDFKHHGSADDDGAFKPIQMNRLTNSWMRRVDFENVSEAHSFVTCANVSAYDIEISGNRGHSAIRSQGSSRVFIGKVYDHSNGYIATDSGGQNLGEYMEGAGQYHGCGVSKQSMGAVIWNVRWGDDSCFESHATQPRATLIDMCTGGFVPWREGGDLKQLPNHLNDLTIWNMNATRVVYDSGWGNKWIWWDDDNKWWKNLPAIIVGWRGQTVNFDTSTDQLKHYELNGVADPLSLYEAQLKLRLGFVPDWLNALK